MLKSPAKDHIITGTYEVLYGTALIQDVKVVNGKIAFEYEGETKVDWDSQKTVIRRGQRLFVDDDFNIWTEAQVIKANK